MSIFLPSSIASSPYAFESCTFMANQACLERLFKLVSNPPLTALKCSRAVKIVGSYVELVKVVRLELVINHS